MCAAPPHATRATPHAKAHHATPRHATPRRAINPTLTACPRALTPVRCAQAPEISGLALGLDGSMVYVTESSSSAIYEVELAE